MREDKQLIDSWLVPLLACPRHHSTLSVANASLVCAAGCSFPIVNGIPVLLLPEVVQSMDLAHGSLQLANSGQPLDEIRLDSLGISDDEKALLQQRMCDSEAARVDPVVSFLVAATNGIAYKNQLGDLQDYPIPEIRLPDGNGDILLDIGCSWGRWCVAAARKGYRVVGIDPSLGAVLAARRTAAQLGLQACFIVGDARYLPIRSDSIDRVFSYSVIQHFSRADAAQAVGEVGRVLKPEGASLIQMPTRFGIRCLQHQLKRGFSDGSNFDVRYWSLPALRRLFETRVGTTRFSVDCYFGIGLQYSDMKFMTPLMKVVVFLSELLRLLSKVLPPLVWVADSVYVMSDKQQQVAAGNPAA